MAMKIEIIDTETVKPSSPTPTNLRTYQLSFLDQICIVDPVPVLLFYPNTTTHSTTITSHLLLNSLSQTLTSFHHFAGRLQDNLSIDCNDAGAEFTTTKVNRPLAAILANPDSATLVALAPLHRFPKEAPLSSSPLLLVRANFFDCGGLAIGVCLCHKAGDASTLSTFLNSWASAALKADPEQQLIPQFVSSASIFPPLKSFVSFVDPRRVPDGNEKIELRRLVFRKEQVEALRLKISSDSTARNPTRVEAVSALIWKCLNEAASSVSKRKYSFIQTVNVRKRMNPSLPENSVGNFLWFFQGKTETDGTELSDLARLLAEGIDELKAAWSAGFPPEKLMAVVGEMSMKKDDEGGDEQFATSSWCRFPVYDADFGQGKPVWVCIPEIADAKNSCAMMDARDGEGMEVALWLGEQEMSHFQANPELLEFASLNPAILM